MHIGIGVGILGGGGVAADVNIVPSDIASLVFWIEADYGTYQDSGATTPAVANNDPVYRINEQKNGYNLVTKNNNYRPLLTLNALNGKPTLVFDGVDDGIWANFTRAVPETIFIVCKELSTDGAARTLMSTYSSANATHDFILPTTANTIKAGSNTNTLTSVGLSDAYYLWSFVENNTAGRLHRNGVKRATGAVGTTNANGLVVACSPAWREYDLAQGNCHNVSIAAILIYDGILSPSEHNQVGKYLADKYGLKFYLTIDTLSDNSLATTTLYRTEASTEYPYLRPSPNSRAIYQTEATKLYLDIFDNAYTLFAGFDGIGIRVNGADFAIVSPGAQGTSYKTVTLPAGDKTVEVINGFQHAGDAAGPIGTYALGISFNAPWTVVAGSTTPRMLVYGDSLAVGARATNLPLGGWVQILKNSYTGTVINEAWSGRAFWDDCSTAGARTTFAAQIAADTPDTIILAIGCNDRNLITSGAHWVNEAGFASAYGDFLDKLHAALPSAVIYAQTPIITEAEAAGIISVRAAITTAQSSRSAFVTLVDGLSIMDASKLDDELHPTTEGQAIYGAFMIDLLGL